LNAVIERNDYGYIKSFQSYENVRWPEQVPGQPLVVLQDTTGEYGSQQDKRSWGGWFGDHITPPKLDSPDDFVAFGAGFADTLSFGVSKYFYISRRTNLFFTLSRHATQT